MSPPPEDTAHEDGRLMHDLAAVNTRIARYLFRYLDADAERAKPISVAEEWKLAGELATLAAQVLDRASRRAALTEEVLTIEASGPQLGRSNQHPDAEQSNP